MNRIKRLGLVSTVTASLFLGTVAVAGTATAVRVGTSPTTTGTTLCTKNTNGTTTCCTTTTTSTGTQTTSCTVKASAPRRDAGAATTVDTSA
jgi:hypothetical protein